MVATGLVFFSIGTYMLTKFNLQVDQHFFLIANMMQGFASGLFFVPLSTLAFKNISGGDRDMASGLFSFSRTLGSSIGIAVFSNIVARQTQVNWHEFSGNMTRTNPNFLSWLKANHYTMNSPQMPAALANHVNSVSAQFAYTDAFYVVMIALAFIIPFCFLLDKNVGSEQVGAKQASH
jgi:DHA2 family multidrug resistance protein